MTDQETIISQLIEKHAHKASMSQYDRAYRIGHVSLSIGKHTVSSRELEVIFSG
jgi:hypothetical protein